MTTSRMLGAFALVLLASSAILAVQAQNSLVVQTDKGAVQGYTSKNVDKWRGIPYAAPPIGNLRFALPQQAQPWSGTIPATLAGPICPQLYGIFPGEWSGKEDCLYANIYAPANRNLSEPLPVLVWIYGGGWEFGDGVEFGLYDGDTIAKKHNIVVVTFNYRLGPLGFLALDAFKNENAAGSVGSYGVYDQVAMLEWVQRNVGAFGGDKTKVTLAGESAGAFSICVHLASPLSKGLFRRAILESGTCSSTIFFQQQKENMAWGRTFANITGCNPAVMNDAQVRQCMRSLDINGVMGPDLNYSYSGYFPLMYPTMPWGATIDGVLLDDLPFNVMTSGRANPVDGMIMGTNHDEGTIFVARLAKVVPGVHTPMIPSDLELIQNHFWGHNATVNAMISAMYPVRDYDNATILTQIMLRDFFFMCPTSRALLAMQEAGNPAYLYQFVYRSAWIQALDMGVYHSAEIEYVFDQAWPPIIHSFDAKDQVMADTFGYYWMNLVKYGDPNGPNGSGSPSQVRWPTYDAKLNSILLDVPVQLVQSLQEDKCAVWDKISAFIPPTGTRFQEARDFLTRPEPQAQPSRGAGRRTKHDVLIATE